MMKGNLHGMMNLKKVCCSLQATCYIHVYMSVSDEYEDYYEDDYYDESNEDYEEGEDLKGIYRKSAPTSDDDEGISDDEEAELAVDRRSSWSIESKYEELEGVQMSFINPYPRLPPHIQVTLMWTVITMMMTITMRKKKTVIIMKRRTQTMIMRLKRRKIVIMRERGRKTIMKTMTMRGRRRRRAGGGEEVW